MARFQEIYSGVDKYYLKTSWKKFASIFDASTHITAMRFETTASNPFYLYYRTYNEGKGWLPYVSSKNASDYAGFEATDTRYVQSVGIKVLDAATGVSLDSKYIVMYRAFMNDKWQPWVSNAKPELMYAVFNEFNLGGSLDTASGDAGVPGSAYLLTRFQIRIFKDNGVAEDDESFTGGLVNSEKSYLVGNTWSVFANQATAAHIDGIKLQTGANKGYYLLYKTWHEGRTSYYPAVKSTDNDYAGYPNIPIQKVNIQVCKNDGTAMGSGVIVMYRALVEGVWQPWVSNAYPEWMSSTKAKLGLDGTLNTSGTYAGAEGKNIEGIEIHIYEDDSTDAGVGRFVGSEKTLSMRYMVNSSTNWTAFSSKVLASPIDGIEIKTNETGYYLLYKTWNEGKTGYYPAVKSTDNDYAGYPGKPIQKLNIKVYKNDGTQLTKDVVVMYRAYVDGKWQSWVSNADPEWMVSVKDQFNLDGSLDTAGGYAGVEGKNIEGIEVRLFEGSTLALPEEELPGVETTATMSYLKNGAWTGFNAKVETTGIDGIKIQTAASKSYYLAYKTQNEGQSGFYPIVTSTQDDYAGASGKPIQKLCIHVYRNDGTKLATGVVVMYRALVDGAWLPWVSNANPEWMQAVQVKYALGGRLDTASYYAGIGGKNIEGIEIRIFEENTVTTTPVGNYKIIQNVPFISQIGTYPTGCESVTTVMALQHAGVDMNIDTFIDTYLDKQAYPFNPNETFGGNPRQNTGFGCYAPVIKKALGKFLPEQEYKSKLLYHVSLEELCSEYIDNNIPVVLWATMEMKSPYVSRTWIYNGTQINWVAPEHCLLLIGYDDNHYIFNDPLKYTGLTYYSKEAVEVAYKGLYEQAIVIEDMKKATSDYSEEYRRRRAEDFFSNLKIGLEEEFGFGQEYELSAGHVRLRYSVYMNAVVETNSNETGFKVSIQDGKIGISNESKILDTFEKLSAEVTTEIGFLEAFLAVNLVKDISRGTISYGLGIDSSGDLVLHFIIEDELRVNDYGKYNQVYKLELIISDKDMTSSSGATALAQSLAASFSEMDADAVNFSTTGILMAGMLIALLVFIGGWSSMVVQGVLLVLGASQLLELLKKTEQDVQ